MTTATPAALRHPHHRPALFEFGSPGDHLLRIPFLFLLAIPLLAQTASPAPDIDLLGGQAEPAVYRPPTTSERRSYYVRSALGPGGLIGAAMSAAIDQVNNEVPEWGQGAEGFGKRMGWRAASFTSQYLVEYGVSTVLHEDTNYYRCTCGGFFPRTGHALFSNLTARRGDGHRVFSISRPVAAYSSGAVLIAFTPDRYTVRGDGIRYGNWQFASGFALNIFREFWPDIRHGVFRR